jgi:hypothetical protein
MELAANWSSEIPSGKAQLRYSSDTNNQEGQQAMDIVP